MMTVDKFHTKSGDYLYLKNVENNLRWTNFAGAPTDYNSAGGKRDFKIQIPDELIPFFEEEGLRIGCWIPKSKNDTDIDDPIPVYTIKVNVELDSERFPCDIFNRRDDGKLIPMSRSEINRLDGQDFTYVDMKLREYHYTKGSGGVSLYLSKASFAASVDPYDQDHEFYCDMNAPVEEEIPF